MFVGAYQSIAWFYAATTGQISIKHGMKGPCGVVSPRAPAAWRRSPHSRRTIRRGVDTVVSGGVEAPIGPYALTCQLGTGFLSTRADPAAAYRPFDARANGYVPGEGGAILLVESLESAEQREAPADLRRDRRLRRHQRRPPLGQAGARRHASLARAMSVALAERRHRRPTRSTSCSPTPSACPRSTRWRSQAIKAGRSASTPASAGDRPEDGVGRLYAGGAALDVAAALLAMRDGVHAADRQPRRAGRGLRARLRDGVRARARSSRRSSSTRAASAASTARSCSGA